MAEKYQYGIAEQKFDKLSQTAIQKFEKLAVRTADRLNDKIREQALLVMKSSGFFPVSEYETLDESDEFRELCMDLGYAFLKSFTDGFIIPVNID